MIYKTQTANTSDVHSEYFEKIESFFSDSIRNGLLSVEERKESICIIFNEPMAEFERVNFIKIMNESTGLNLDFGKIRSIEGDLITEYRKKDHDLNIFSFSLDEELKSIANLIPKTQVRGVNPYLYFNGGVSTKP
jgi:hypothetical protein